MLPQLFEAPFGTYLRTAHLAFDTTGTDRIIAGGKTAGAWR